MIGDRRALRVVTPEHVEIRLVPAGLGSRFLAITIDSFLTMLLPLLLLRIAAPLVGFGFGWALYATAAVVVTWGYHVFFEIRRGGRTPGKRATGLRVVDDRGLPLSVQQSLVRNVVRALDVMPLFYGVGAIAVTFDQWSRRLGDVAARTIVIEEPETTAFVETLAEGRRFTSLRTPSVLRAIRHRIGLEERELLVDVCLRADAMSPDRRFALMAEIGSHYRESLDIDDPNLSDENLVRGLAEILSSR